MRRMRRMIVILALLAVLVSVAGVAVATNISVDGTLSEWATEDWELTDPPDVVGPVEWAYDIMDVYSTTDDNGDFFVGFSTYAAVSVTDEAFLRVYFDVDPGSGNGESKYGMGVDYRVFDWDMPTADDSCTLQEWTGSAWSDVGTGDSYCNGAWASDVEISVSGTHVALGNPMEIRLYFDNGTDPSDDSVQWVFEQSGGQGCTPGYWKQPQHFDSWLNTPYDPTLFFDEVFEVVDLGPHVTLLEAVWLRGGGEAALARHAVAALLNAANPGVSYEYADVITQVQEAYATGNFEVLKDDFAAQNELGCPLD